MSLIWFYVSAPLPPGRITDLRVLRTDTSKYQVMLQWTAQGAKLDVGAGKGVVLQKKKTKKNLNDL